MFRAMKYTITSRGKLLSGRRYPIRPRAHPQIQGEFYTRSLVVRDKATDEEKLRAGQAANQTCENYIKVWICTEI